MIEENTLIEEYKKTLDEQKVINKKLAQLKAKILEENKPNGQFGTFHFGGFNIVIGKKIDWNQEILSELHDKYNFIRVKYDLTETLYNALPDDVKADLEDARTIKQGTITINLKDENND